jgi:hypothetical protein
MSYFRNLLTIGVLLVSTTAMSFALKAEYRFELCNGDGTTKNYQNGGLDGNLGGDANISINGGKIQNGLSLSGDGMMSVEHNANLDLVNNLTIAFWVNPNKNQRQALISRGGGDTNITNRKFGSNAEYSLVLWENGKFKYKHNGVADTFSTTTIPLNQWTHIVLVRDNNAKSIKIYINGILDKTNNYTIDPSSSNSEKLLIGTGDFYSNTMNSFKGKLDEIKIYNIALSQDDITNMYSSEKNGIHLTGGCTKPIHKAPETLNDSEDLPYAGTLDNINILSNDIVEDSDRCELNSSTVQFISIPVDAILSDNNKTVTVPNEGSWHVRDNGLVSFVSLASFVGNPTEVTYVVWDSCGSRSNEATITLTRVAPSPQPTLLPLPTPIPQSTPTPIPQSTPVPQSTAIPQATATPQSTIEEIDNIIIGDKVWYDTNRDGIQDSDENGVSDVIVVLYDSNGSVIKRTTTDSSGEYNFNNLSAGIYSLGFTNLPDNYIFTSENMGDNDAKDSDVDSSGRTALLNIGNVENDLIYDAGIVTNPNIIVSTDNNNNTVDCDCKPYKSTIPSINSIGMIILLFIIGLVGSIFIKREEFI